jgi:hypothetical protein
MTRNEHDVRVCFRHARRDSPDTRLSDELDVDASPRIRILEIVDELLQIFDQNKCRDVVAERSSNAGR